MTYRIHAVGKAHAKALAELHTKCFPKGWSHLEFESFFERNGVFAAMAYESGGKPVGFVLCWLIEDQCDLLSMGVLPDYRRDGVGIMLLDYATHSARDMGGKYMVLEVNVNNEAAQTLYEAQGYEKFSIRKDYYSAPDGGRADAVCMRKAL
ncbi:MAG: ribosomal protein S18-alanine N-acetyltransferase [Rickettsiales bacterium]